MAGSYRAFAALAIFLALVSPIACLAGPYEDGMDAYMHKHYALAMKLWRPLAENNDVRAQTGLAKLYFAGLGVNRDYAQALFWGEKAAKQGEPRAQFVIGSMYRDGTGVTKDLMQAVDLFQKAANQNHAWAQYTLGLMYNLGEGVPRDRVEAYKWLSLAMIERDEEDSTVIATAGDLQEIVRRKLTPDELAEAEQRVQNWKPVQPR